MNILRPNALKLRMYKPNGYAYVVVVRDTKQPALYRDFDDKCVMQEITARFKDVPCNIEYLAEDLAFKRFEYFEQQYMIQLGIDPGEDEDEEYFDDEPDYDCISADESWSNAFEQHRSLHS